VYQEGERGNTKKKVNNKKKARTDVSFSSGRDEREKRVKGETGEGKELCKKKGRRNTRAKATQKS
jgi:hypothetical protein